MARKEGTLLLNDPSTRSKSVDHVASICVDSCFQEQSFSNTQRGRTLTSSTCSTYCPTTTLFISPSSKTLYVHVHLKRKCPYTIGQGDLKKRYVQGQRSLSSDAINIGSHHMHTDSRRKKKKETL